MSTAKSFGWIGIAVALLAGANVAFAQHGWARTITVDPSGNADHQFIHNAIADNRIGSDPSQRYTILVYAGTYTIDSAAKLVELGDAKENVDLVGIDREAVIIDVTIGDAQNPRSGIKITSGTETSRDCRIANLTIKTTNGHGIEIVKGGTPLPKDITIEGVTIEAAGSAMNAIYTGETQDLRIANCKITTTNGHGIEIANTSDSRRSSGNVLLHDLTIRAAGEDKYAIRAEGAEGVPEKQHLRVNDLLLYDESALCEPNRGARKP